MGKPPGKSQSRTARYDDMTGRMILEACCITGQSWGGEHAELSWLNVDCVSCFVVSIASRPIRDDVRHEEAKGNCLWSGHLGEGRVRPGLRSLRGFRVL